MARVLTYSDALWIREEAERGRPRKSLAQEMGVGLETISRVIRGESHTQPPESYKGIERARGVAGKSVLENSAEKLLHLQDSLGIEQDLDWIPGSGGMMEEVDGLTKAERLGLWGNRGGPNVLTPEEKAENDRLETTRPERILEAKARQDRQAEEHAEKLKKAENAYNAERQAKWRANQETKVPLEVEELEKATENFKGQFHEEPEELGPVNWDELPVAGE